MRITRIDRRSWYHSDRNRWYRNETPVTLTGCDYTLSSGFTGSANGFTLLASSSSSSKLGRLSTCLLISASFISQLPTLSCPPAAVGERSTVAPITAPPFGIVRSRSDASFALPLKPPSSCLCDLLRCSRTPPSSIESPNKSPATTSATIAPTTPATAGLKSP